VEGLRFGGSCSEVFFYRAYPDVAHTRYFSGLRDECRFTLPNDSKIDAAGYLPVAELSSFSSREIRVS
jgi:hypothetical protein